MKTGNREKNMLAVCDRDAKYTRALVEYLNIRRAVPYEVYGYTDIELFLDAAREHLPRILLISGQDMCEAVRALPIPRILVLTEREPEFEGGNIRNICKFQTAENLYREVMAFYAESCEKVGSILPIDCRMQMIAVYSPVKRTLKTSFAMTLGQILAEERRTLYINLEDYAGFNTLLQTSYMTDMSDLMYYISQERPNFIWKLASIVQRIGKLDFIPPALAAVDIRSIPRDRWLRFFRELAKCDYEMVILDLGESVDGVFDLLRMCTRIYTPTRDDGMSYAKMEQYEALLQAMDYGDVLEKTRKLSFSYFQGVEKGLDRLVFSDLGKYVRKLLMTEDF